MYDLLQACKICELTLWSFYFLLFPSDAAISRTVLGTVFSFGSVSGGIKYSRDSTGCFVGGSATTGHERTGFKNNEARARDRSDRGRFLPLGKKASSYRGAYRVTLCY